MKQDRGVRLERIRCPREETVTGRRYVGGRDGGGSELQGARPAGSGPQGNGMLARFSLDL